MDYRLQFGNTIIKIPEKMDYKGKLIASLTPKRHVKTHKGIRSIIFEPYTGSHIEVLVNGINQLSQQDRLPVLPDITEAVDFIQNKIERENEAKDQPQAIQIKKTRKAPTKAKQMKEPEPLSVLTKLPPKSIIPIPQFVSLFAHIEQRAVKNYNDYINGDVYDKPTLYISPNEVAKILYNKSSDDNPIFEYPNFLLTSINQQLLTESDALKIYEMATTNLLSRFHNTTKTKIHSLLSIMNSA